MFRVLVLGGIALTACGGATVAGSPSDSGTGGDAQDAFPSEGPDAVPPIYDAFPSEADPPANVDAFPTEGPAIIDSGPVYDSFPTEGPAIIDSGSGFDSGGSDVGTIDSSYPCFPQETALPADGCAPLPPPADSGND
jgi:hypothetical protein